VNFRVGCVAFPVGNGGFVDADLVGDMPLQEPEVQPTCPDMIP